MQTTTSRPTSGTNTDGNPYQRIPATELRAGDVLIGNVTGEELPVQLTYPYDQVIVAWTGRTDCRSIPRTAYVRILRRDRGDDDNRDFTAAASK